MERGSMTEQICKLFSLVKHDPEYAAMRKEYMKLEESFSNIIGKLPEEDENIAWAFICLSDAMNWRMLELLCLKYDIGT